MSGVTFNPNPIQTALREALDRTSPTPRVDEADADAQREWLETGLVPMEYVQDQLRQGWASGRTIADIAKSVSPIRPVTPGKE